MTPPPPQKKKILGASLVGTDTDTVQSIWEGFSSTRVHPNIYYPEMVVNVIVIVGWYVYWNSELAF